MVSPIRHVAVLTILVLMPSQGFSKGEGAYLKKLPRAVKFEDPIELRRIFNGLADIGSKKSVKSIAYVLKKSKSPVVQHLALSSLRKCPPELVRDHLIKAAPKIGGRNTRVFYTDVLASMVNETWALKKGVVHSQPLVRSAAYLCLSVTFRLDQDHSHKELKKDPVKQVMSYAEKESKIQAMRGLAVFLNSQIEQDAMGAWAWKQLRRISPIRGFEEDVAALSSTKSIEVLDFVSQKLGKVNWRIRLGYLSGIKGHAHLEEKVKLRYLVQFLKREKGHLRRKIVRAMQSISGQKIGFNPQAWEAYINNESFDPRVTNLYGGKYYSLDIVSKRIIFILDRTGSMVMARGSTAMGTAPEKWKAAQDNLCKALDALLIGQGSKQNKKKKKRESRKADMDQNTAYFSVITFSGGTQWWSKKMVPANPDNVKEAKEWVRKQNPGGATHSLTPLKECLEFARKNLDGKEVGQDLDTLYFVTDGMPETSGFNRFKPGSWPMIKQYSEDILAIVKEMNREMQLTIHGIGIKIEPSGDKIGKQGRYFLKRLTSENHGDLTYID